MDNLTPAQRHRSMSHIHSKDTAIEIKLRKELWRTGIRYRKNYAKLIGKPDIAITRYRLAVFCDSSFWHGRNFDRKKLLKLTENTGTKRFVVIWSVMKKLINHYKLKVGQCCVFGMRILTKI